jgi:hypothetical protein
MLLDERSAPLRIARFSSQPARQMGIKLDELDPEDGSA